MLTFAVVVGMVIPTFCRGLTDHLALSCAKYVSPLPSYFSNRRRNPPVTPLRRGI